MSPAIFLWLAFSLDFLPHQLVHPPTGPSLAGVGVDSPDVTVHPLSPLGNIFALKGL